MPDNTRPNLPAVIWLLPAFGLLFALVPMPYAYFIFLRVIVCGAAVIIAFKQFNRDGGLSPAMLLMVGVAVLFNPIMPIHLSRLVWAPIDILTAATFVVHWKMNGSKSRNPLII